MSWLDRFRRKSTGIDVRRLRVASAPEAAPWHGPPRTEAVRHAPDAARERSAPDGSDGDSATGSEDAWSDWDAPDAAHRLATPSPPTLRVHTVGLASMGHPELELSHVPADALAFAERLLHRVAATTSDRPLTAGQRWAERAGRMAIAVGVYESTEGALLLSELDAVRREAPGELAAPLAALSHLMARRAYSLAASGQRAPAIALLRRSIAMLPGIPRRAREAFAVLDEPLNDDNHLSHLLASELEDSRAHYVAACARSPRLRRWELGEETSSLPIVADDKLARDAARIVECVMDAWALVLLTRPRVAVSPARSGDVPCVQPVLRSAPDVDALTLYVAPAPAALAGSYFEGPAAAELRSPEIARLAAEVYARHRGDVVTLLGLTYEARRAHRLVTRFAALAGEELVRRDEVVEARHPYQPHWIALSAILADLGRRLAAGLDRDELRASLDLHGAEGPARRAADKLTAFAARERTWLRATEPNAGLAGPERDSPLPA